MDFNVIKSDGGYGHPLVNIRYPFLSLLFIIAGIIGSPIPVETPCIGLPELFTNFTFLCGFPDMSNITGAHALNIIEIKSIPDIVFINNYNYFSPERLMS